MPTSYVDHYLKTSGSSLENSSDFKHCFGYEVEGPEWISDCRAFSILKTVDVSQESKEYT